MKAKNANRYLDTEKSYNLQPDLILQTRYKEIIANTKYKVDYQNDIDPKAGISHADVYQMLAYSDRYKTDQILLFLPSYRRVLYRHRKANRNR